MTTAIDIVALTYCFSQFIQTLFVILGDSMDLLFGLNL